MRPHTHELLTAHPSVLLERGADERAVGANLEGLCLELRQLGGGMCDS